MNQEIKFIGDIILIFTWFDDNKVYVKYFKDGVEIESFDVLNEFEQQNCLNAISQFQFENDPMLILYSY